MELNEELKCIKDILQSFLKSKKILRMYPSNNPIYINTLEDDIRKFKEFFYIKDELTIKIKQNEIFYESDIVYSSTEKDDNLALFFFKDGLRELTFKKGLLLEELEDFLKIISLDFNRDVVDDDIITLFWEKDFQNIHYVVDDVVLIDDEEDYEAKVLQELEEKRTPEANLLKAYEDAFREEEVEKEVSIVSLADKDLQQLLKELERDALDKTEKLIDLLFELLWISESKQDFDDLAGLFSDAVEYAMGHGDFHIVTGLLSNLKKTMEDRPSDEAIIKCVNKVIHFAGSEAIIRLVGENLDSVQEIEDKVFEDYVKFLDRNAIDPFMKILGELQSIHARKIVIEALIMLGTKDIATLAKGLNDSRWYVVRNIIYVLRKIGDKRAVDYLLKTVKHGDIRVKKEVIRALGELGGTGVLQALRECLDDPDMQVKSAALKSLASVGTETAKRIVMYRIIDKNFRDKEFEEKKECFEVLARWKDKEVYEFMVAEFKKTSFFARAKSFENRACAAHGLGLTGNKDAIPILSKCKTDGNKLLREYSVNAIKRLEYGQQGND